AAAGPRAAAMGPPSPERGRAPFAQGALRYPASAYPDDILRALAAKPPEVSPLSAFYDVLLSSGVRTALAKPVQLTLHYSTAADPSKLNLYWYNEAANAYVLQQDVGGAPPVKDASNRTFTVNVDHFSTFVLFETGVAVISGNAFAGSQLEAFNFPNPFDLGVKAVTPIHGNPGDLAFQSVRGTMIRVAVPPGTRGAGRLHIFNVAGERVRTMELGELSGGQFYYQGWDGRNDAGRDSASGVYIGQVKVGGNSAFFKMALIK
ncbi:MAG: FlgD immunoglobulin-like domain containing protein, partial [Elusimicrobiota bacterium]